MIPLFCSIIDKLMKWPVMDTESCKAYSQFVYILLFLFLCSFLPHELNRLYSWKQMSTWSEIWLLYSIYHDLWVLNRWTFCIVYLLLYVEFMPSLKAFLFANSSFLWFRYAHHQTMPNLQQQRIIMKFYDALTV